MRSIFEQALRYLTISCFEESMTIIYELCNVVDAIRHQFGLRFGRIVEAKHTSEGKCAWKEGHFYTSYIGAHLIKIH